MKKERTMKKYTVMMSLGVALMSTALHLNAQTMTGSAESGKQAYFKNGCWGCHGFVGQGGIAGPKLAPEPKPIEYIQAFVRHTKGPMPPYSEKILSNQELVDIHAYLKSIQKGPDYKSIPLLN
ncbi:cytochrome c [Limnohabitans sp. 2KL-1]|uniref:c-type cytochrome n=1 Tax=Limnohabitans sp. 2KL-1 TaxID=1100699 RepID=UPI0013049347|nr:cytochrome c [Limnohabitans sp. 2KL-1]